MGRRSCPLASISSPSQTTAVKSPVNAPPGEKPNKIATSPIWILGLLNKTQNLQRTLSPNVGKYTVKSCHLQESGSKSVFRGWSGTQ